MPPSSGRKQILITDAVALRKMIVFAVNNECEDVLARALLRLLVTATTDMVERSAGPPSYQPSAGDTLTIIGDDFAPMSLRWHVMQNASTRVEQADGKCIYAGGFIYHGPGVPGDGSFPALSVSLSRNPGKHEWGVHT
jgi:hypothetical protein